MNKCVAGCKYFEDGIVHHKDCEKELFEILNDLQKGEIRISDAVRKIKKENANSGYPLLGEVRADIQELLQMIAEIPCTCDKIYTDRKLRAPDCPRCNWVEDDIVKKVNEHFA